MFNKGKVISLTSKTDNYSQSLQRRPKKYSELELRFGTAESPYKTYYTYEEFMCDKLSEYLGELEGFRNKISEAEQSIIRNFQYPKFGKSSIRKKTARILTRVHNKPKEGDKSLSTTGYKEAKKTLGVIKEGESFDRRKQREDIRIRTKRPDACKIRRTNVSSNQRREESPSEKSRVRSSTETSHCNRSDILRGEDPLLVKMIKRRKELRIAEQREHEQYLKYKLNDILTDIDSTKNFFLRRSIPTNK